VGDSGAAPGQSSWPSTIGAGSANSLGWFTPVHATAEAEAINRAAIVFEIETCLFTTIPPEAIMHGGDWSAIIVAASISL
jgi:hypothetical protein